MIDDNFDFVTSFLTDLGGRETDLDTRLFSSTVLMDFAAISSIPVDSILVQTIINFAQRLYKTLMQHNQTVI